MVDWRADVEFRRLAKLVRRAGGDRETVERAVSDARQWARPVLDAGGVIVWMVDREAADRLVVRGWVFGVEDPRPRGGNLH